VLAAGRGDLGALEAEQNVCYFVDHGLGKLKVFSEVIAGVLLAMLRFLDDSISDAFRDVCRFEAVKHKIEQDGIQDRLRWLRTSSRERKRIICVGAQLYSRTVIIKSR
jgi:hypothetical protein